MADRAWLENLASNMPVQPPFTLNTYAVRAGGNISSGPDHQIVGVEIVRDDKRVVVPTLTPQQARSLAEALLTAARDAESRTWFRPNDANQQTTEARR